MTTKKKLHSIQNEVHNKSEPKMPIAMSPFFTLFFHPKLQNLNVSNVVLAQPLVTSAPLCIQQGIVCPLAH